MRPVTCTVRPVSQPTWQGQSKHPLARQLPSKVLQTLLPNFLNMQSIREWDHHNSGLADNRTRILFQRGVYPSDDFHMVKKYGQTVLVTQDLALENYLER